MQDTIGDSPAARVYWPHHPPPPPLPLLLLLLSAPLSVFPLVLLQNKLMGIAYPSPMQISLRGASVARLGLAPVRVQP